MKKIINGKLYNTDTAEELALYSYSNSTDFNFEMQILYRKKTGEFFLYGTGGPNSRYAVPYGSNSWTGSSEITPFTEDEAKKWLIQNDKAETYISLFGEPEE